MLIDRGMNYLVTWNLFCSCEPIIIWTHLVLWQLRIFHSKSSYYFLNSSKQSLQDGQMSSSFYLKGKVSEIKWFPRTKSQTGKSILYYQQYLLNIYYVLCTYQPRYLKYIILFIPSTILRLCIVISTLKWENWSPESKYNLLVRNKIRIQAQIWF